MLFEFLRKEYEKEIEVLKNCIDYAKNCINTEGISLCEIKEYSLGIEKNLKQIEKLVKVIEISKQF